MVRTQIEAENYKEQLEKQKDYEEIKQERDQLKNQLNQKENQIITKIISELKLGLEKESDLEQVLEKIKELIINKSPNAGPETEISLRQQIAEQDKDIKNLREQNKENHVLQETIKKGVRETFRELGIGNSVYQKELSQISSCQELEIFRQKAIRKEFGKIRKQKNEVENLNIILWVLFISSVLTIILLIIKIKRSKLSNQSKRTKGK